MTESRGLIRLLNQVIHSRAVLGIFDNSLNMGPSMTSLAILFFILGLEKVLSVAGDNAIAASALRMFWSLAQAIVDSVKLPPAESPATIKWKSWLLRSSAKCLSTPIPSTSTSPQLSARNSAHPSLDRRNQRWKRHNHGKGADKLASNNCVENIHEVGFR